MEKKVFTYIKEKKLIQKDSTILVAVSGGPDSLALLHFLWRHQKALGASISAITVDHQLRSGTSAADAQFVANTCRLWDIPCKIVKVDVAAYKKTYKTGTQIAARELRYEAFHKQMIRNNIDYLAFGHHADDQIETVLMALLKTTHVHNLGGMPEKRSFADGEIIRPFLSVEKNDIMDYAVKHGLHPRIDETNAEKDYLRNRLRADILPLLKQENPNLSVTIGKLAANIQEDSAFLEVEAKNALKHCVRMNHNQEKAIIHATILQTHPLSLQRKVYRLTLDYLYDTLPENLSYKHEETFLTLLRENKNRMVDFPRGMVVEKSYDKVYMFFSKLKAKLISPYYLEKPPSRIRLQDGTEITCATVHAGEVLDSDKSNNLYTYICSETEVCFPLSVRPVKTGERMTYDGLSGTKKVQRIFIDEKVPRYKRATWPILTDATGEVLWVIGLKKHTKMVPHDARYVCIEVQKP